MEASDKDGLSRGYGAVLWPPAGQALTYARNALRTAWTDPARTAIVFDSERSRTGRLTHAELATEVARVAALPNALANPAALAYFGRCRGHPRGS